MKRTVTREKEIPFVSSKGILVDLLSARPALKKLRENHHPHNALIDLLLEMGEEDPLPKNKALQARFNLSPARLRKWLEALHADFMQAISESADFLSFQSVETFISIFDNLRPLSFRCRLPFLPRVGEQLTLPFIQAVVGHRLFYVEDINYELVNDTMEIWLLLKPGSYNAHFDYLKHQARFENQIGLMEEYQMSEYELKNVLRKLYR